MKEGRPACKQQSKKDESQAGLPGRPVGKKCLQELLYFIKTLGRGVVGAPRLLEEGERIQKALGRERPRMKNQLSKKLFALLRKLHTGHTSRSDLDPEKMR